MLAFMSKRKQQVTNEIAKKPGNHILVDLKLDRRLKPVPVAKFEKATKPPLPISEILNSSLVSSVSTASEYSIGSARDNDKIYHHYGDLGLFGAIFEAWKNHWVLRTSPEDWWFPVACRIAKAIDNAADEKTRQERMLGYSDPASSQKVRDMFVSHSGKEKITVSLPVNTIYEANYDQLFSAFSAELEQRIKKPDYAQTMQNDFSTSGSAHIIEAQINLMASMQAFFEYEMVCLGCGLRGLEMEGSVEDWERLVAKLEMLRDILKPIENETGLHDSWYDHTIDVFKNLAMTRRNPEDPRVAKWWINILCNTTGTKWVGGGGSMPGKPKKVKAYDGWLVHFLAGLDEILAEDLAGGGAEYLRKELSGLNQVPLKVSLTRHDPPLSDESTLVAGILGFKVHKGEKGVGEKQRKVVPSVQPYHMWAMLLPCNSPLRSQSS